MKPENALPLLERDGMRTDKVTFRIEIKLFAGLNKYEPGEPGSFFVAPDTSVSDLLDRLGAPHEEAKLIFINGRRGNLSTILKDGDRLGIFPPVGGG